MSTYWTRIKRTARFYYLRIIRLKASAHSIALGTALGIFVGFLPIIPFQTVVVLTLAFIFKANKLTAGTFTFISNPLNMPIFYYMLFVVGSAIIPVEGVSFNPNHLTMKELITQGWEIFLIMCTGGVVLGIPSFIATYFLSRHMVLKYRKRRGLRLLAKHNK